jgi:hypothetical protein
MRTRQGVGKFMAENQGSDVDEESHPGPTDVHRMACDTQQGLADLQPWGPTENNNPSLTIQGHPQLVGGVGDM